MIEGTLVVNLDPPYMGFLLNTDACENCTWCYCTLEQMRDFLVELGLIHKAQQWPPREYILRLPARLPINSLAKHGLLNVRTLEFASVPDRLLKRIS
jgi:hypothetical protein